MNGRIQDLGREFNRHVLDVDKQVPLDSDGFLQVLSAEAWWFGPDERPQPVSDLAHRAPSFVLLAPAGAGKSTVLDALRALEPEAVAIDLRTLDLTGMREALSAAKNAGYPVYLDALDEAAIRSPGVFRLLERELASPEGRRLLWRLACRPAAWNASLAQVLSDSLPGFRQLRLLPLHRQAAWEVVTDLGIDPKAFFDVITGARLGRLAANPMQLQTAAKQWRATGRFPDNALEAIRFELDQLLPEVDPGRPRPSVAYDRQLRIARRLGAVAIFCGTQQFAIAGMGGQGVAPVATLPSAPEPDEPGIAITPDDYETVLGTALFDAAAGSTVTFHHHQYAEYLAAAYLVERGIDRRRLRTLLGVKGDGLLPGVMAGVAAWLTALDSSLTADLVAANALQFARAGVEMPSNSARVSVIEGILAAAAVGDIDVEWGLDVAPLIHPGLEEQLGRSLASGVDHPEHLWWVAKLGAAGRCVGLVEQLLRFILDSQWPIWARGAAVDALRELGSPQHLEQLRPLLHLNEEEDPDDELFADTIEALYPRLLTTADLIEVLRPRRNRDLVGGYLMLLGRLAQTVPEADLPMILEWLAEHVGDGESYGRLPAQLLKRGWELSTSGPVLQALATALSQIIRSAASYELTRRTTPPWANAGDERRRLAVAVAEELNSSDGWLDLLDLRVITTDDALWLLEVLPTLPKRAQPALAACLPQLVHEPSAEVAERILTLAPDHPAYEPTAYLRTPVALDSDTARRWRRRRAIETEERDDVIPPERHRELLLAALTDSESDSEQWWKVVHWLSVEGDRVDSEALFSHDLTRRPGWSLLDEHEGERVIAAGLACVRTLELQPEHWRGQKTISTVSALRDWAGVYLLTTLARHDAQRVHELEVSTWARLAPAIVGAWNFDRDDDRLLRAQLVRLAPGEARPHIAEAALDQLDADAAGERGLPNYLLYEDLIPDIDRPICDRILEGRYSQQLGAELLDLLAEHAPEAAVTLCHELRGRDRTELSARAARHLARLDAAFVLEELVTKSPSKQDVVDVVPHLNITDLDVSQLSQLARLLLNEFPFADDPPAPTGGFRPDALYEARQTRGRVLNLLTDLGATDQLKQFLADRPQIDRAILRRLIRRARTRAADLAVTPLSPDELISLLSRADARLVRDDSDLLEAVLEQLNTLQDDLMHGGAFRDLWNEGPSGIARPKSEDDISDWVRRNLQLRLTGSIIDREIHVSRPRSGGIGTRVDLAVTTITRTQPAEVARVIIEVKLINNRQLLTALTDQLCHRYLEPTGQRHGVYLVCWISPDQRPSDWSRPGPRDRGQLQEALEAQAAELSPDFDIRLFIMDISPPG